MDAINSESSSEIASGVLGDQGKMPFNITRDLTDLKVALLQLKEDPKLATDQPFDIKMVDYLNNYVDDYNAGVKNGTLTAEQQIALSDLNEDLKVNGLIEIFTDGVLRNPNTQQNISDYLSGLLDDPKENWICIINKAIDSALGTPSK